MKNKLTNLKKELKKRKIKISWIRFLALKSYWKISMKLKAIR
jgi:hypothetical protein